MGKKPNIDLSNFPQFKRVKKAEFKSKRSIESIQLKRISLEEKFKKLMKTGDTFLITNPEYLKRNSDVRTMDGIFSPNFGPDLMKVDSHEYTCDCGAMTSAINEGKVCPKCETPVQYMVPDIRKPGFIDIAPFNVLTFHGLTAFRKHFGKGFDEVFTKAKPIDMKGKIIEVEGSYDIMDLYDRYEDDFEEKFGIPKNIAFTSKILVINSTLRPLHKRGNNITLFDINKSYLSIVQLMRDLKMSSFLDNRMSQIRNLNGIQRHLNDVYEHVQNDTKGKDGLFKKYVASGRVDYSSRMVIVAGVSLKPHEVRLPYKTVMEVFEEELIEILCKLDNISVADAFDRHAKAMNHIDKKFVSVINIFLRTKEAWVMIDRNPTIKHGSILYMKVVGVNKNINNVTMEIPLDILNLQGADFDGDQETAIGQKIVVDSPYSYHEIFKRSFCPTYLFINRATGYFNRDMSFKKDQIAIISELWDLSSSVCDYVDNPEIDSMSKAKVMKLLEDDNISQDEMDRIIEDNILISLDTFEEGDYDNDLVSEED